MNNSQSSKTDPELMLNAFLHAQGGMQAVQEYAPQGDAAGRYAKELGEAIVIVNRMQRDETSGDVRVEQPDVTMELPEPFVTVYVFGVKRPIDSEPWYLAFTNQEQANHYPHRCTKVTAVLLYPPAQRSESQSQSPDMHFRSEQVSHEEG